MNIICDTDKYKGEQLNTDIIEKIEGEYYLDFLCCYIAGTHIYDIDNSLSDKDFKLIFRDSSNKIKQFQYFDQDTCDDIICLQYDYIRNNSQTYLNSIKKYPSILSREAEDESFDFYRSDYFCHIFFELLASNYIIDNDFLEDNIPCILSEISPKGVIDYYYSRAYGNLHGGLQKDSVDVKKYLTSTIGICTMKSIIKYREIPNQSIESLISDNCPECLKDEILCYWNKHRNIGGDIINRANYHIYDVNSDLINNKVDINNAQVIKPKCVVSQNREVNQWIEEELANIAMEINSCDFVFTLGNNSILGRWYHHLNPIK